MFTPLCDLFVVSFSQLLPTAGKGAGYAETEVETGPRPQRSEAGTGGGLGAAPGERQGVQQRFEANDAGTQGRESARRGGHTAHYQEEGWHGGWDREGFTEQECETHTYPAYHATGASAVPLRWEQKEGEVDAP